MDTYGLIVNKIIQDQQMIIGPIALQIAKKVGGISILGSEVHFSTDPKMAIQDLVGQYKKIFGEASVEICKESAHNINVNLSDSELPDILK